MKSGNFILIARLPAMIFLIFLTLRMTMAGVQQIALIMKIFIEIRRFIELISAQGSKKFVQFDD